MKTTTLPPIKVGKNQKLLPSGVIQSADGKYHYWRCSVSGLMTFAKPDYWVKIMAKFKTEENLVKNYVCKKAQALVADGKTQAEIIAILSSPETSEVKKAKQETKAIKAERKKLVKKERKKGLKTFAVAKTEVETLTETGSLVKEVVPVYPWQGDANYFKGSGTTPLSTHDATKDACIYPARHIDDDCQGCPAYAMCQCSLKVDPSVWKKGRINKAPKITQIDVVAPF